MALLQIGLRTDSATKPLAKASERVSVVGQYSRGLGHETSGTFVGSKTFRESRRRIWQATNPLVTALVKVR